MVTLNKPAQGNTNWYQPVTDNWTSLEKQVIAFQGRLQRDSTTQVSLQRYCGDTVDVNGESVSLGAGGIALSTTDNLISSTGSDSGGAMAITTLYYVYVSNSSASPFPSDLRASTTAPSSYNGIKYLGTTGNAANWRFVGYVRTISNGGTPNFADSETQRLVINYYNRRVLRLFTCPAYNNNNAITTYTTTSTTFVAANSGTGSRLEFIANGEDAVWYAGNMQSYASNSNVENIVGVGENSTTSAAVARSDQSYTVTAYAVPSVANMTLFSEGYNFLELLIAVGSNTLTVIADYSRRGSSADPYATYLIAELMG